MAPITHLDTDALPEDEYGASSNRLPIIFGAIAALLLAGILALYFLFPPSEGEPDESLAAATVEEAKEEDPNADRPQEWFDNYADKFLSAELTRLTSGQARKRSFPTAKGGEVLDTLAMGRPVTGRWVEGADPETRWLKTNDGGYIWEGNLTAIETITSAGMMGMVVDARMPTLRSHINPQGLYGDGMDDWESDLCEIYRSRDELVDVMMEEGKATSFTTTSPKLATARGIRVGSSEAELKKAYGNKLKSEPNPYDGSDYFVWDSKDRGIKFHVTSEGKIDFISSGGGSIRYVEGCL